MIKQNLTQTKPNEAANNAGQVSNSQPSAEEQKNNNPQSNTAEESKTVSNKESEDNSGISTSQPSKKDPDILKDNTAQIFSWLENVNQTPRQLKGLLDTLDTRIELIEDILDKQSKQAQKIPGVDKRIETMELFDEQIETGDRYLSGINKIKLQTELTNLREKRFQVWQKFVKACGSEKKALKYQNLRAKAKSSFYHSKSSYFVKQRILKILNTVIQKEKQTLEDLRMLADASSDDGVKLFNERLRELLDIYDEDLVILCSHVKRKFYFKTMQLSLLKWNPETDLEIVELTLPNES